MKKNVASDPLQDLSLRIVEISPLRLSDSSWRFAIRYPSKRRGNAKGETSGVRHQARSLRNTRRGIRGLTNWVELIDRLKSTSRVRHFCKRRKRDYMTRTLPDTCRKVDCGNATGINLAGNRQRERGKK